MGGVVDGPAVLVGSCIVTRIDHYSNIIIVFDWPLCEDPSARRRLSDDLFAWVDEEVESDLKATPVVDYNHGKGESEASVAVVLDYDPALASALAKKIEEKILSIGGLVIEEEEDDR